MDKILGTVDMSFKLYSESLVNDRNSSDLNGVRGDGIRVQPD